VVQRRVKCSNNYFIKNVAVAAGGVSLFCFGPCGFSCLTNDCLHFQVLVQDCVLGQVGVIAVDANQFKRQHNAAEAVVSKIWLQWLESYAKLLSAIAASI
jgi:hypothetical protein